MKNIDMQKLIISVCFLFIITTLNAQKSFSSDLLIGEWFYQGPEKPKVNDTIKLIKDLSVETLSEYTKWEFSESNIFDKTLFKRPSKDKSQILVVKQKKLTDDKWFFDNSANQLKIQQEQLNQVFRILSNRKGIINLVKLK